MADSQRETLRNLLVTEFAKIDGTGDYRTTVKKVISYKPFDVQDHPAIVVELAQEEISFQDTNKHVGNSDVRVRIWGHFQEELEGADIPTYAAESAGEPLLHDIKRVIYALMIRDVNASSSPRWKIQEPIRVSGPDYTATNRGFVMVEFQARLLFQGSGW